MSKPEARPRTISVGVVFTLIEAIEEAAREQFKGNRRNLVEPPASLANEKDLWERFGPGGIPREIWKDILLLNEQGGAFTDTATRIVEGLAAAGATGVFDILPEGVDSGPAPSIAIRE